MCRGGGGRQWRQERWGKEGSAEVFVAELAVKDFWSCDAFLGDVRPSRDTFAQKEEKCKQEVE